MSKKLLHTPEGVRDIYNREYAQKEATQAKILTVFQNYGYRGIQTPSFEFFDIFSKERGSVRHQDMYKFFDRDGNTLVLRPDITPSIARSAAKYFMDEDMPVRLSYYGNTFINKESYQGRLKEVTAMGAELIGDATSDADAEMIAMLIDSLLAAGLTKFQIEIGQVDFFYGLMTEAAFNEEEQERLRELVEEKNHFGVEAMLSEHNLSKELRDLILNLSQMFGSIEQVSAAGSKVTNDTSAAALKRLQKLYQILQSYGMEQYVSFDLGMLGNFKYYTGIVFKAYTYETGDAIATGGRYDQLLTQFGKDSAATGFGIVLDKLLLAMNRQQIDIEADMADTILLYERKQKDLAIKLAVQLRKDHTSLLLMKKFHEKTMEDYIAYAKRNYVGGILYLDETGERVSVINVTAGTTQTVKLEDFM